MIRRHLRATRIDTLLRPTTLFQSDPQQPEGQGSRPGRGGRSMSALLALEGVHAHYGKSHILHGVDFHVAPGEVVSLLGRNGSGRSTTMKNIMGLVPATTGEILLQGRRLSVVRSSLCSAPRWPWVDSGI